MDNTDSIMSFVRRGHELDVWDGTVVSDASCWTCWLDCYIPF